MSVLSRQRLPGPPAYAVVCDGCSVMKVSTPDGLRAGGWQLDSLEHPPHLCPTCAARPSEARNATTVRALQAQQA